jgi:hypothetical protein
VFVASLLGGRDSTSSKLQAIKEGGRRKRGTKTRATFSVQIKMTCIFMCAIGQPSSCVPSASRVVAVVILQNSFFIAWR